jgi:hypothetical protein
VLVDTHQRRLLLLAVHPLRVVAELWPAGYQVRGLGNADGRCPIRRTPGATRVTWSIGLRMAGTCSPS